MPRLSIDDYENDLDDYRDRLDNIFDGAEDRNRELSDGEVDRIKLATTVGNLRLKTLGKKIQFERLRRDVSPTPNPINEDEEEGEEASE